MKEGYSKTAFIVFCFLIGVMIIGSPVAGLIAGKLLGAIGIGWVISGILIGVLLGILYENDNKLNDDFKWRFSKDAEAKEKGVKL